MGQNCTVLIINQENEKCSGLDKTLLPVVKICGYALFIFGVIWSRMYLDWKMNLRVFLLASISLIKTDFKERNCQG